MSQREVMDPLLGSRSVELLAINTNEMVFADITRLGTSIDMGNLPCPNTHPKYSIGRIMGDARYLNNVPEDHG